MIFPQEWIEEVCNRNDIVDVVSEYVQLKQSGRSYVGLCPFHQEKTPSFNVNHEKQFYYCFGCQVGGNVIHFIMNIERLPFVDSVKLLAERAHMPLPEQGDHDEYLRKRSIREKLAEIHKVAALYYHRLLLSSEGKPALSYLKGRGIEEETIRHFGLGFAADRWDGLLSHLRSLKYSDEDILESGLVSSNKGRYYDRFRNRVIFPIINIYGKVIGFGGRVLDNSLPKYLNSPEGVLFNKSQNLYGLNFVKQKRRIDSLIVVEGYMDVISLHQGGIENVVASLGTSLTHEQARLMKRYCNEIYIAYDGDTAGQKATMRGMEILRKEGCQVKVISFPDNMDPDEFIRKEGKDSFVKNMEQALSLTAYKLECLKKGHDLSSSEGKTKYAIEAAKILSEIENPVEIEAFLKKLQVETGFTYEALKEQVSRNIPQQGRRDLARNRITNNRYNKSRKMKNKGIPSHLRAEYNILVLVLKNPEKADRVYSVVTPESFSTPLLQKLAQIILSEIEKGHSLQLGEILNNFPEEESASKIAEIFSLELEYDNIDKYIDDCIDEMKRSKIEYRIKQLQDEFSQNNTNKERRNQIIMEIQALNLEYQKMKKA
ncbi:MAG: DNA primase [Clostridia bacterium]|jgi:DNA primase